MKVPFREVRTFVLFCVIVVVIVVLFIVYM